MRWDKASTCRLTSRLTLYSSNEVVVECPVLDHTEMGRDDEEVREYLAEDDDGNMDAKDEVVMEAYDNARNNLEDRIDAQGFPSKKQYRLLFPSNVHLSGKVLEAHKIYKDSNRLHMHSTSNCIHIGEAG